MKVKIFRDGRKSKRKTKWNIVDEAGTNIFGLIIPTASNKIRAFMGQNSFYNDGKVDRTIMQFKSKTKFCKIINCKLVHRDGSQKEFEGELEYVAEIDWTEITINYLNQIHKGIFKEFTLVESPSGRHLGIQIRPTHLRYDIAFPIYSVIDVKSVIQCV